MNRDTFSDIFSDMCCICDNHCAHDSPCYKGSEFKQKAETKATKFSSKLIREAGVPSRNEMIVCQSPIIYLFIIRYDLYAIIDNSISLFG